ncbi:DUF4129 domain-containing protein [Boudabousia marimammalium]|uniref:Protein-glutamine gamma-glutamyltransferase-like C-terminal domain-containing protein n=1 Tax=Boudabousia marimammalium TaxID=156892 RepID=A0A1Q5PRP7_9ACTO|nr:DUF4129 domain-containing protein [Boudabousia marimammalium]OKL50203.1 hypothetical protein BM477_02075 [Boudabousia marimammalium]
MIWRAELTPDGPTARDWAEEELSRLGYRSAENPLAKWIARFFKWLFGFFDFGATDGDIPWPLVALAITVGLVIITALLSRPYLLKRSKQKLAVFDEQVTRKELEKLLKEQITKSDWTQAVITQFRIMVKALDYQGVLVESPGLTALEVSQICADQEPLLAGPLLKAATTFNNVRYGEQTASEADFRELQETSKMIEAKSIAAKEEK